MRVFSSAGLTVHQIVVAPNTGLDFGWKGRSHYAALHDLQCIEAETFTDAQPVDRRCDLRGRFTFIPAGCEIWGWSIPTIRRQSFTALYLDPAQMESEMGERLRQLPETSDLYFLNAALRSTFEKLRRCLTGDVRPDAVYVESLCLLAMLELCIYRNESLGAAAGTAGTLARPLAKRLADYVEANLSRSIGLKDLAGVAGLSRFHFLRVFRRTTGQTPYQYLLERRIAMAQSLLKDKEMTLAEVAVNVGFQDATRLIRAFRKVTGTTPGAYRASRD